MNYDSIKNNFDKYVETFDKNDFNIALKYEHSYKVAELMEDLALKINLSEEEKIIAKVTGLVHDIGRFIQLDKYNSYSDSNEDHGDIGDRYLNSEKIRYFSPNEQYDSCITLSVKYHNKFDYPKLNDKETQFVKMIRDTDKIDIYRVLNNNYEKQTFKKEELSEEVLNDFMNKKQIRINKAKTPTDRILLHLAFLFDINYKESFALLKEKGYFNTFINNIIVNEEERPLFDEILDVALGYIEQGGI